MHMPQLVDGQWIQDDVAASEMKNGAFHREPTKFRSWITRDGGPGPDGQPGFAAEAGRYQLNEESVQLVDITEDCIGMVQLRAKAKSIRITDQFEPDMPSLWADEKSIRQVILNLLSNAVKFTPSGGEIVIKVGWTGSGGQYVSIKDNGPGIPEEEIPVVLSAFGQGSIAIKSAEQGTGLGLPIVQAILHKHDGQFLLKSKLREGTEVIAILPAKRVLQSLPAVEDAQAIERKRKSFA